MWCLRVLRGRPLWPKGLESARALFSPSSPNHWPQRTRSSRFVWIGCGRRLPPARPPRTAPSWRLSTHGPSERLGQEGECAAPPPLTMRLPPPQQGGRSPHERNQKKNTPPPLHPPSRASRKKKNSTLELERRFYARRGRTRRRRRRHRSLQITANPSPLEELGGDIDSARCSLPCHGVVSRTGPG